MGGSAAGENFAELIGVRLFSKYVRQTVDIRRSLVFNSFWLWVKP